MPEQAKINESELKGLISQFNTQVKRYENIANGFSSIGHRLKDTNYPKAANDTEKKEADPEGIVTDFRRTLDSLYAINERAEETLSKIGNII